MKKALFLGTALMIGAVSFAQSGAKKSKAINPKYLEKTANYNKQLAKESSPTQGKVVTPTIAKLRPNSNQGGSNPCGLQEFTTSWNCFGVGGGSTTYEQNCLSYNSDLNTLIWTHRGTKTWPSVVTGSGFFQATLINPTIPTTFDSIITWTPTSTHLGRFPSGVFLNPVGNTDYHKAYAVSIGVSNNGTNWLGTAYTAKPLWSPSAINHTVPPSDSLWADGTTGIFGSCVIDPYTGAPSTDVQALSDGKTVVAVASILDPNYANGTTQNPVKGATFVKGVLDPNTKLVNWTTTSIIPDVYISSVAPNDFGYKLNGPRMAFGPDGQTGYIVFIGMLNTRYNNYAADSSYSPIVYKTVDGGTSWVQILAGYDWTCKHPEVKKNVGELEGIYRGYSFDAASLIGSDLLVDANGVLHYVSTVKESYIDRPRTDHTNEIDSVGAYIFSYDYDYINYHPIIWDFMTDGNDWKTMLVDSVISSPISYSSNDTTQASSPMGGSSILGVTPHLTVSRSLDGTKIFYGWADSDPNVVAPNIYGQVLNTNPDIMIKAWDLTTNKVSTTKNSTSSNPFTGACFYPFLSDISFFDGTNWVAPAVFTVGHIVLSTGNGYNVYDASSQADYHYSDCGTFSAADFTNATMIYNSQGACGIGINKTKAFDASITNYPNPFSSTTTIAVNLSEAKAFSINVYNTIGALVYSKTVNGNVGTNNVTFDGSALNAGVYYYTVNAGNQQTTKKMVIAK